MGTITDTVRAVAKDVARYEAVTADSRAGTAAAAYALGRMSADGAAGSDTGLPGTIATAVVRGMLAGVVGTVAMTLSTTIEMKLRDRAGSSAPQDAVSEVLGIEELEDEDAGERLGTLAHWGYGLGLGAIRGLYAATGMSTAAATAAHFVTVWGAELVMLPALDVSPPATEWGAGEIAIDAWHHGVYAVATGIAYDRLDGHAA